MRLLFFVHNAAGGGQYLRAFSFARALAARGHRVTMFAAASRRGLRGRRFLRPGVEVLEPPDVFPGRLRRAGLSPCDLAWRLGRLAGLPADLVHAFDHRPAVFLPAFLAARLNGAPLVRDWEDLWGPEGLGGARRGLERLLLAPLDAWLEGFSLRRAAALTSISADLRRRALRAGVPAGRILLLPAGSDVEEIRPRDCAASRRALGVPPDALVFVYSGASAFDDRLLGEAFALLARQEPRARLLLVGANLPLTRRLLAEGGLAGRLLDFAPVPHARLGEYLACGDVLLLPYADTPLNRARSPNKAGDYLAAGRAIVANPTGDLGALLAAAGAAQLAPAEPAAFAAAALALARDEPRAAALGRRARQFAEEQLAYSRLAAKLEEFYDRLKGR